MVPRIVPPDLVGASGHGPVAGPGVGVVGGRWLAFGGLSRREGTMGSLIKKRRKRMRKKKHKKMLRRTRHQRRK